MPKISFIIPIYNAEKYIRQCLDSIVNQTLKDIEIICVDDESNDSTPQILQEYAQKDSRVMLLRQKNARQGAARNNGMAHASGEYIVFVDSDDWCELGLAEEVYSCATKNNANCVRYNFTMYHLDGRMEEIDTIHEYKKRGIALARDAFNGLNEIKRVIMTIDAAPWKFAYKREFLLKHDIKFPTGMCTGEDVAFTIEVKALTDIFYLSKSLYNYRVLYCSASHNAREPLPIKAIVETSWQSIQKLGLEQFLQIPFDLGVVHWCLFAYSLETEESKPAFLEYLKSFISEKQFEDLKMCILKEQLKNELKHELRQELINELKFTPKKFIQGVFSVKNNHDKTRKIVRILGIKMSFKKKMLVK